MSDETSALTPEAAEAARKAAAETLERDMAEISRLSRLAAKYNLVVMPRGSNPAAAASERPSESRVEEPRNSKRQIDMTMGNLIVAYKADPRSPYGQLRYRTRLNYDSNMNVLEVDCGADTKLAD